MPGSILITGDALRLYIDAGRDFCAILCFASIALLAPLVPNLLSILAFPISTLYASVAAAVGRARQLRAVRSPLPVISVGNVSVGGSGKTPLTIHLAQLIQQTRPCIVLSRGYGREEDDTLIWWSGTPPPAPERYGDEPSLIARRLHNGAIGVARRRADLLAIAVAARPTGVILLDDGFQHRGVARDLDVVIVDDATANAPYPIPSGRLREWPGALGRADVIVATSPNAAAWAERYRRQQSLLLPMRTQFDGVVRWHDGSPIPHANVPVILATGIANPERVTKMLNEAGGGRVMEWLRFKDHHRYTRDDAATIANALQRHRTALLLTTEKDAVKLEQFPELQERLAVMKIRVVIDQEERLIQVLQRVMGQPPTEAGG